MTSGIHLIIYSKDADADKAFLRDVLNFPSVDVGRGWLIFGLPPAEIAIHPDSENGRHEIYLMCEDIRSFVQQMVIEGIECSEIQDQGWGQLVQLTLPGGGMLGVYEPMHPSPKPMKLKKKSAVKKIKKKASKKKAVVKASKKKK